MAYKRGGWTEVTLLDEDGPFDYPTDMLAELQIYRTKSETIGWVSYSGGIATVDYINLLKIVDDGRVPIVIMRDLITWMEHLGPDEEVIQTVRDIAALTLRLLA